MKQEATKKNSKKLIWIIAAVAAVLVIAGVVLALFLLPGEQNGPATTGGRAELYFNIDREIYTKDAEMGFSTRKKADDGMYHIRFAYDGEQVELPVSDKRLVNFIDTMDIVALVKDADGVVIDAKAPKDVAFVIAEGYYVRKTQGDIIQANSSVAMNGMDTNIKLTAASGVYDVASNAEVIGQTCTPQVMDQIYVYGDLETQEVTHVFVTEHPADGDVYWRVTRMYDATAKETTREPDAEGAYTITFAVNGKQVDLKCKDKIVVNAIDGLAPYAGYMTLEFDEEGYIIDMDGNTGVVMVLRGKQLGANYRVEAVDGNTVTATKVDSGNDQGKTIQFTYDDSMKIYQVDQATVDSFIGEQITEFRVNDAITFWGDLNGKPLLAFVLDRLVPGPMYYNLTDHSVDAVTGLTLHVPDENGYYVYEMLADRKVVTLRTKDINIATQVDSPPEATWDRLMGLEVDGDIIKRVYTPGSVSGMHQVGYQRYLSGQSGPVYTFAASDNLENVTNVMMAPDVKIYDVSGTDYFDVEMGAETTLNLWDRATVYRNIYGEAAYVYVTHRYVSDADFYCVADRQWDATNLVSKRQPDADGYYVFQLTKDGKQLTAKTKNKDLVQYIDKQSPAAVALKIEKGIIKMAYPRYSVFMSGATTSSWQYVDWIKKDGTFATWYTDSKTGEKTIGWPYEKKMSKDCQIYNISSRVDSYKGEKTDLRVGDQVQCIMSNMTGEIVVVLVLQRYLQSPFYWNLDKQYDWTNACTTRVPDADGYYVYDKIVVNGEIKTFRTKSKDVATAIDGFSFSFAMEVEGDIVKQALPLMNIKDTKWAVNYHTDVTKIEGNKLSLKMNDASRANYGESYEMTLAEGCQIWDVSPTAVYNGKQATLSVGDRVVPITNSKDEVCAIFIISKMTRAAGAVSYCEHCGKEVTWAPYSGHNQTADAHYYLAADLDQLWQGTIGAAATEEKEQLKSDVVLDLNGKTLTYNRQVFVVYGTLTVFDTAGGGKMVARNEKKTNGAAFMIQNGGVFNLHAGTVMMADVAETNSEGGLVMTNPGGTFNMYGGTLKGGRTNGRGGNVFAYGGTFNMYGGEIVGGSASNGANVHTVDASVNGVNYEGVVNIYGGKITDGGVKAEASADLKIEGKPVIGGTGIRVPMGSLLNIGTLKSGASIVINGDGLFAELDDAATATNYKNYFIPVRTIDAINAVGNTLVYTKQKADLTQVSNADLVFDAGTTKALCPVCGEKVTWTAITDNTKYYMTDGGHYYLPADVTYTDPAEAVGSRGNIIRGSAGSGGTVCLHLNGHNMTATNATAISIMGAYELNIMGNGTVSGSDQQWSGNALMVNEAGAKVNLIGGTYTKPASEVTGSIMVIGTAGGTIEMYDGATIDATGKSSSNWAPALTVYGGVASGETAAKPAVFNMHGGQILGGTNTYTGSDRFHGGNVLVYTSVATLNVQGGTISGGEHANDVGDVIAVRDGGTLIIGEDATVTAGASGDAIYANLKDTDTVISGTVNGSVGFAVRAEGELVFSGKPVVTGAVNILDGNKITLTDLEAGTSIKVKADGVFAEVADNATATTYAGYFGVNEEGDTIAADGNKIVYTKKPVVAPDDLNYVDGIYWVDQAAKKAWCPACRTIEEWTELSGSKTAAVNSTAENTHFYLSDDYSNTTVAFRAQAANACLHLNGHTMSGSSIVVDANSKTVNIVGTGTISTSLNANYWGAVMAQANGTMNIFGNVTITKTAAAEKTPLVHVSGASSVANIEGNVTVGTSTAVYNGSNSAAMTLRNGGTINMVSGTVYGGNNISGSGSASAISWYTGATETNVGAFNMTGGTIEACTVAGCDDYAILIGTAHTSVTIGENAVVKSAGNAINQWSTSGDLTVSGHVTGKVQASKGITLTGTPEISNLVVASGVKADATGMTGGDIKVNATDVFTTAFGNNDAATAALDWFESLKADTDIEITTANELKVISTAVTPPAAPDYSANLQLDADNKAVCPACGESVTWTLLSGESSASVTVGGHYYLTGNYTYTGTGTAFNPQAASCLHLGDKTFSAPSGIAVSTSTNLNIMGTGTITAGKDTNWQGTLYIAGGNTKILGDVTITKASTALQTAIVFAYNTAIVDIEGDVTIGTAGLTYSSAGSSAITLRGSGTNAPVVNMKNGTVIGGDNTAGTYGSCVTWYMAPGTFNMTGGELTTTSTNDAVIYIGSNQTAIIGANATLTGAKAMLAYSGAPSVTISGTVTGSVDLRGTGSTILTGAPSIGNLIVPTGAKVDATGMTGGKVYVTASGVFTTAFADANKVTAAKAWFESLTTDTIVTTTAAFELQVAEYVAPPAPDYSANLQLDADNKAVCPVCGGEAVEWTVLSGESASAVTPGGHYYLTGNYTYTGTGTAFNPQAASCLHLGDKTFSAPSGIAVSTSTNLNIMGTGTITAGKSTNWQGTLYIAGGNTKILGDVTITKASTALQTAIVFAYNTAIIDIEGDVTIGEAGQSYSTSGCAPITLRGNNANVPVVNMKNGTVIGGENTAGTYGSCVTWYAAPGTFNMTGGELTTASTNDAVIYMGSNQTAIIGADATLTGAKALLVYAGQTPAITISGTATGAVDLRGGDLTLTGAPTIGSLKLPAGVLVDASGMTGGSVTMAADSAKGVFTKSNLVNSETTKTYFHVTDSETQAIKANPADLELTEPVVDTPPTTLNYTDPIAWVNEGEKTAWCPKCRTLETWTELTADGVSVTADGHYYLAQDKVTFTDTKSNKTAAVYINTAGVNICLHLNGKTLESTNTNAVWVRDGATLNIMGNGTVLRNDADKWSSTVRITHADAEVNLYAGTITKPTTNTTGMVVFVYGGGKLNQYADATIGQPGLKVAESATVTLRSNNGGACVYNMYGGTVYGADNDKSGGAYGSAVEFYDDGNTFNMVNGQIIASDIVGSDDYPIFARGAFTGNIGENAVVGANAAGQSFNSKWISTVDLTIAGTVNGSVNCTSFVANLEGQPKLVGAAKINGLILDNRNTADISELTAEAEILVDVSAATNNGVFTKASTNAETVKDCFTATGVAASILVEGDTLVVHDLNKISAANLSLDADNKAYCPVCRETVTWTAVTGNGQYLTNGNHYYIADGATITSDSNVVQLGGAVNTCLHLNGGNITSTGATAIRTYASFVGTLNIMGTGTITGTAANYYTGAALSLGGDQSIVNLYGNVKLTKSATDVLAPVVYMPKGQVNMYGNVVLGEAETDLTAKIAGTVFMYNNVTDNKTASLNMYGGTIYGVDNSSAAQASAVMMSNTGTGTYTFNMLGGNVYATDVAASDDYTIYAAAGCVVNIGANATVGTTAAGNTFYNGWVGAGQVLDITIAGNVEGLVNLKNITAASIDVKLVGAAKAKLYLSVTRALAAEDLAGLTAGAKITVDTSAHNTGIFTTGFATKEAAEAAMAHFVAAEGYQLSVTEDTFQIQQTLIPVEEPIAG